MKLLLIIGEVVMRLNYVFLAIIGLGFFWPGSASGQTKLAVEGPSHIFIGDCEAIQVSSPTEFKQEGRLALKTSGKSQLFEDAKCTKPVKKLRAFKNYLDQILYVKGTKSETLRILAKLSSQEVIEEAQFKLQVRRPALLKVKTKIEFGLNVVGASETKVIKIRNVGETPANDFKFAQKLERPFHFKGGNYPGEEGTCARQIDGGSSCDLVVEFRPQTTGKAFGKLQLSYFDGASYVQTETIRFNGRGEKPAVLKVSKVNGYDFGRHSVRAKVDSEWIVQNTGESKAKIFKANFSESVFKFKKKAFPGHGGTCEKVIPPQGKCSLVIQFEPDEQKNYIGGFTVHYFDGLSRKQLTRTLKGSAKRPGELVLNGAKTRDFGSHVVDSEVTKKLKLENRGSIVANKITAIGSKMKAPFEYVGGTYPGMGGTCGEFLKPKESCLINVKFQPTQIGSYKSYVVLGYYNGAKKREVELKLKGVAVKPARLSLMGSKVFHFGKHPVGSKLVRVLEIKNHGKVLISGMRGLESPEGSSFSFAGGEFPGKQGTCRSQLKPGESCKLGVEFHPKTSEDKSGLIHVVFQDGLKNRTAQIRVTGSGLKPASVRISHGPLLVFPSVVLGMSSERDIQITNEGEVSAVKLQADFNNPIFSFVGGKYPGEGGTCKRSLAPGKSCQLKVSFNPEKDELVKSLFRVRYRSGKQVLWSDRKVQGEGRKPAILSFEGGTLHDFGKIYIGTGKEYRANLVNQGDSAVENLTFELVSEDQSLSFKGGKFPGEGGTCKNGLKAQSSCKVVLEYVPKNEIDLSGELRFKYQMGRKAAVLAKKLIAKAKEPGCTNLAFGENGRVTVFERRFGEARDVKVLENGKFLVAGSLGKGKRANFALAKFTCNGKLDKRFGSYGKVITDISGGADRAFALAVQKDGKIILGGYAADKATRSNLALVRYLPNGKLDPSFGRKGKVSADLLKLPEYGYDLALQEDGKIIMVGRLRSKKSGDDFLVARFLSNGRLDKSFNKRGFRRLELSQYWMKDSDKKRDEGLFDVSLLPNGKILASGHRVSSGFVVFRLKPDGSLDSSFGEFLSGSNVRRGFVVFNSGKFAQAVGQDEKEGTLIGVTSQSPSGETTQFNLIRLKEGETEKFDTSFGDMAGGIASFGEKNADTLEAMVVGPEGKILLGGGSRSLDSGGEVFALARFEADGDLDDSFGDDGLVTTDFKAISRKLATVTFFKKFDPDSKDRIYSLALQHDGKILAVGRLGTRGLTIVRYRKDGTLDTPQK